MNLSQFLERWPAKDSRLFLFAGGKDYDRLSIFATVCDRWSKQIDLLDRVRLHQPNLKQVYEACQQDPITSRYRLVIATEVQPWEDNEGEITDSGGVEVMSRFLNNFPRDVVLVMSTALDSPLTKNDFAQPIIRKGYWVVLKNVDVLAARELVDRLTQWDEELIQEVVEVIGTSPSQLIAFIRMVNLAYESPSPKDVRELLIAHPSGSVFELVDAVIEKDIERALALSNIVPIGQFVGAMDRKLTVLLQFLAELKRGRGPKEAAAMLRMPGFIVHGLWEASKRWQPAEILGLWPLMAEFATYNDRPGASEVLVRRLIGV